MLGRDSDWDDQMHPPETRLSRVVAEVRSIQRENTSRDKKIEDMAADIKALLAIANQGRGGLWTAVILAGGFGSLLTFILVHIPLK